MYNVNDIATLVASTVKEHFNMEVGTKPSFKAGDAMVIDLNVINGINDIDDIDDIDDRNSTTSFLLNVKKIDRGFKGLGVFKQVLDTANIDWAVVEVDATETKDANNKPVLSVCLGLILNDTNESDYVEIDLAKVDYKDSNLVELVADGYWPYVMKGFPMMIKTTAGAQPSL